jgi:hypothetical protein
MMPADMVEEFDQQQSAHAIQLSKVTASQGAAAPSSGAAADPAAPEKEGFPKDIEKTANAYFQSVYTGQITIDEIVTLLKNFKASKNKRYVVNMWLLINSTGTYPSSWSLFLLRTI